MEIQSTMPEQLVSDIPAEEIRYIPLWVKSMIAFGVILFLIQIPNLDRSISDVIQKNHASQAYKNGYYLEAINLYKGLYVRYPKDNDLIKELGFSYYHTGQYPEALKLFDELAGIKMKGEEADKINDAINQMVEIKQK